MPGPCPNGRPTVDAHEAAKCREKGACVGPGCRVRREERYDPILDELAAEAAEESA